MNNDINNTQKIRRLGSMSVDEFFGGGNVPIQDLHRSKLEDIPEDVVELANKMIRDDANLQNHSIGGGYPQTQQPQAQQRQNSNVLNTNIDGKLDIDLFQLAVGKDVVSNIDGIIEQHEQSIKHLRAYKNKLCQLLNIKEERDESK
jgi:hypothetical protein